MSVAWSTHAARSNLSSLVEPVAHVDQVMRWQRQQRGQAPVLLVADVASIWSAGEEIAVSTAFARCGRRYVAKAATTSPKKYTRTSAGCAQGAATD